jgi:hypothetical protein
MSTAITTARNGVVDKHIDWYTTKFKDAVVKHHDKLDDMNANRIVTYEGRDYKMKAVMWNKIKPGDIICQEIYDDMSYISPIYRTYRVNRINKKTITDTNKIRHNYYTDNGMVDVDDGSIIVYPATYYILVNSSIYIQAS